METARVKIFTIRKGDACVTLNITTEAFMKRCCGIIDNGKKRGAPTRRSITLINLFGEK